MWNNRIEAKHKYGKCKPIKTRTQWREARKTARNPREILGAFHYAKIPKFLVGIQKQKARSVSVSSDRNIRDHL